jgi:hypothetical protein
MWCIDDGIYTITYYYKIIYWLLLSAKVVYKDTNRTFELLLVFNATLNNISAYKPSDQFSWHHSQITDKHYLNNLNQAHPWHNRTSNS